MSEKLIASLLSKVKKDSKVLFVWQGVDVPANFEETIKQIQSVCGNENQISVEHLERFSIGAHTKSSFDCVLSNILTPTMNASGSKDLVNFLTLLKPNGFYTEFGKESSNLESELKLNGFKNISLERNEDLVMFYAEKPSFEVGAATKLKFASKNAETTKKVWKFTEDDINEDDLINTDDLLDDLDLKKPVIEVRDCGVSKGGKKKACKGCSCGLAEEIEQEATGQIKKNNAPAAKSACGSCYLGDAFRCASCPYLGMPAFKAGEKVQLSESLLKADI